jgi:hypothetical protein
MGFRSTFVSMDHEVNWPQWFIDIYKATLHIGPVLSSRQECKFYLTWLDLFSDIQKAIASWSADDPFVLVILHECGGIDRVEIYQDKILFTTPNEWLAKQGISHDYCYGCSNARKVHGEECRRTDDEDAQRHQEGPTGPSSS